MNALLEPLERWYAAREAREQRLLLMGGIAAVVIIALMIVLALHRHVAATEQRVARKRADLAWLRVVEPSIASLPSSSNQPLRQSLVVVVAQSAREAGLDKALGSSEPHGDGALAVRLNQAPFDSVVTWLSRLHEQHGIIADSANIDAAAAGIVNASLVLRAP